MPARSVVLLLSLLSLAGFAPLAAEDSVVPMAKRGNIRFGPSLEAPVATTLNPGDTVQVLHPVEGRQDWYAIRFPRQGRAWMHEVVLAETDDPRVFRVTQDQAHVRSDSTTSAEVVDVLDINELVDWVGQEIDGKWFGRKVGAWYAVYPRSATAYVHQSVLRLGGQQAERITRTAHREHSAERLWQQAQRTYRRYRQELEERPQQALDLDWTGLGAQLAEVVEEHPSIRSKLMAKKMYAGIRKLQHFQRERGVPPISPLPALRPEFLRPEPASGPALEPVAERPEEQPQPEHEDVVVAEPDDEAELGESERWPRPGEQRNTGNDDAEQPAEAAPVVDDEVEPAEAAEVIELPPDADAGTIGGWLIQRDVEGVDAGHALIDADNQIQALVQTPEGSEIRLAEYFWRRVAVRGDRREVDVEIDGRQLTLPLITVDELRLQRH